MVSVDRLRHSLAVAGRLIDGVFSPGEKRHASGLREQRRFEFLAGRFAVKEAVLKAAGCGFGGPLMLTEIETLPDEAGRPRLTFLGQTAQEMSEHGVMSAQASISHECGIAVAIVIMTQAS